jgi:methyl-accepting chemotaxis protein
MKKRLSLSIQAKVIAACFLLIASIVAFSVTVVALSSQLGGLALTLYDNAFVSVHYAHKVQTDFVRLEGRHTDADLPLTADDDTAAVASMLNNMDVVAERSATAKQRAAVAATRADLASLVNTTPGASRPTLASIDKRFKHLTQRFADDALESRNNAEALIARLKLFLVVMAGAAVLGALALAWFLIGGLVAPLRQVVKLIGVMGGRKVDLPKKLLGRADEIGSMVAALAAQQDASDLLERARLDQAKAREAVEQERVKSAEIQEAAAQAQVAVVDRLSQALDSIAGGDLTFRLSEPFPDEYERLRVDFNSTVSNLRQTLADVAATAWSVANASSEISDASEDLSRRTEQQAANLEQTAAALDEITVTVKRSADGAKRASASASGAKADAERSVPVVRDAVTAMGEIKQGSSQIAQIIGVIDEIAFQTNLLALNAGVEAARAGDAGRGFAVVAQEVRALAQRSAAAAKEIKALISSSASQVEKGVRLVADTGEALTAIAKKINEIDVLISEIAESAQEESIGLAEVNTAVNQMDQVTQQNAAMVQESASAATSLKAEAETLSQLVARFQIGDATTSPPRLEPAEPPRHAPGPNPVVKARAKLAVFARGGAAPVVESETWEDSDLARIDPQSRCGQGR